MKPLLTAVVAMDRNRLIGAGQRLPWHLPADLAHFRRITTGGVILMGRHTHESIGRPLPDRLNIVISRTPGYRAQGCVVVDSPANALEAAGDAGEVFVIGGAGLFKDLLSQCSRIYLTLIHHEFPGGDTWMPELEGSWKEIHREDHPADERNAWPYSFMTLERD